MSELGVFSYMLITNAYELPQESQNDSTACAHPTALSPAKITAITVQFWF